MANLTWNDLEIYISTLDPKHRNSQVFCCVYGDFIPVDLRECSDENDFVMDDGTPYLEAE